jgi:hypothetical protein
MRRFLFLFVFLLCLAGILGAGCEKKPVAPAAPPKPERMSTDRLAGAALQAWMSRDYAKSELYYQRLLQRKDLDPGLKLTATKRLALSAFHAGHYHQALDSLESWRSQAERLDPEWGRCYVDTLLRLDKAGKLADYFQDMLAEPVAGVDQRFRAGMGLASLYWERDRHGLALQALQQLYDSLQAKKDRLRLERRLLTRLEAAPAEQLERFASFVTPENMLQFPYALAAFDHARRRVRTLQQPELDEQWPQLWRTLSRIASNAHLVELSPLQKELVQLEKRLGVPRHGVAMLLPLSGRYAPVAWNILKGAGAAQWRLTQRGADMEVKVLNTEAPGFEERLRELPPYFTAVGGPLRREALDLLLDGVRLQDRALFAFLPKLPEGVEEGQGVWRFFTSPRDQVRSLLDLTAGELDADKYCILHPDERYGERMSQIFAQEVRARNGTITASQEYKPGVPTSWGGSVEKLAARANATNTTAVFIPDAFSRAKLLFPYFFFFNEGRLLFLGPEMWSQALSKDLDLDMQYLSLAVCPGSWWAESRGARKLATVLAEDGVGPPDYWSALGYDFVRMASRLGALPPHWDPSDVNQRLSAIEGMTYSLAPFSWNATGHARQDLYLFQPSRSGKVRLDMGRLRYRIDKALEAHEWRMETLKKEKEKQEKKLRENLEENDIAPGAVAPGEQ